MIAKDVSKIGIPKIIKGTNKDVKAAPLNSSKVIMEIINPIKVAESPANIFAG